MNILAIATGSLIKLIIYTFGITILVIVATLTLFWVFNKNGWINITVNGPRWYKIISALGAISGAIIIGVVMGFQIGLTNVGLDVIENLGPSLIVNGFENNIKTLGISDINEKLDLQRLNTVVAKFDKIKPFESSGIAAKLANDTFNEVKENFIRKIKYYIKVNPSGSKISISEIVANTWSDIYAEARLFNRNVTISRLIIILLIVLALACFVLLFNFTLRVIIKKINNRYRVRIAT
jgi:hypothetical protein